MTSSRVVKVINMFSSHSRIHECRSKHQLAVLNTQSEFFMIDISAY